jgi:hypothetical protein
MKTMHMATMRMEGLVLLFVALAGCGQSSASGPGQGSASGTSGTSGASPDASAILNPAKLLMEAEALCSSLCTKEVACLDAGAILDCSTACVPGPGFMLDVPPGCDPQAVFTADSACVDGSCDDLATCLQTAADATHCTVDAGPAGCGSGLTQCSDGCDNLPFDNGNCGACGLACPGGETCAFGVCTGCSTGQTACAGVCTDLNSSAANCGACGHACATGDTCQSGQCETAPGTCAAATPSGPCAGGDVYCGGGSCCSSARPYACPGGLCYASAAGASAACGSTACVACVPPSSIVDAGATAACPNLMLGQKATLITIRQECQACRIQNCCQENTTCYNDLYCGVCYSPGAGGCRSDAALTAMQTCEALHCSSECVDQCDSLTCTGCEYAGDFVCCDSCSGNSCVDTCNNP